MILKACTDRATVSRFVKYLYFLRFPMMGWLILPLFCLLDGCGKTTAITRGILTMSGTWQIFHVTFFVTALLMTVLVCARNVTINGFPRFGTRPPAWLHHALSSTEKSTMLWVLLIAHLPTLVTLIYVGSITHGEAFPSWSVAEFVTYFVWTLLGFLAAFAFWYLVSLFYLWTYPNFETREPAALIFPGKLPLFQAARDANKPRIADWLETVAGLALKVTYRGYAKEPREPIWELHFLSTVALGAFLLLYFFLYPLIAPVLVNHGFGLDVYFGCEALIAFVIGAFDAKAAAGEHSLRWRMSGIGVLFSMILLGLLGIFLRFYVLDQARGFVLLHTAFPTLGAILVILIFFQWLFSGLGFLLDRYRLPVLTTAITIIFCLNVVPFFHTDEDHYFEALATSHVTEGEVDTPYQIIQHRQQRAGYKPEDPLVVVTASGGGIQAAEWTAQVMATLEKRFHEDQKLGGYELHDHLLLVSSVSGGSVGMTPYLLEYTAGELKPGQNVFVNSKDDDQLSKRLTRAPGCSSLEAVGWGLEYYDMQKLLIPWRFSLHTYAPDRTWALGEAFNRNLEDDGCGTGPKDFSGLAPVESGKQFTLKQAAKLEQEGRMPAFAFNTMVAETGGRFLLSNYQVPPMAPTAPFASVGAKDRHERDVTELGVDFLPAESFLQAYAEQGNGPYADLSLTLASRLGATFPLVSSATRIPREFVGGTASHFLDGGYFDNDGTATATEFLFSALQQSRHGGEGALHPLRVLLVEIRDGSDLNPDANLDDLKHQTGELLEPDSAKPKPWTVVDQLMSPLEGLWNAGHVSVSRRNRRELCALETAYTPDLEIHHVVFAIPSQLRHEPKTEETADKIDKDIQNQARPYKSSPLSWKLTPAQQAYIERHLSAASTQAQIADALSWVEKEDQNPSPSTRDTVPTCQVIDELPPH